MALETQLVPQSIDAFATQKGVESTNDTAMPFSSQYSGEPGQHLAEFQQAMLAESDSSNVQGIDTSRVEHFNGQTLTDSLTRQETLGDKILSGLQTLKSGFDVDAAAIQNTLMQADPLSVRDMLKTQLDLAKFALRGELMNKTVSQGSQNIDTLLKSQ